MKSTIKTVRIDEIAHRRLKQICKFNTCTQSQNLCGMIDVEYYRIQKIIIGRKENLR
jgi:hypothetical protein